MKESKEGQSTEEMEEKKVDNERKQKKVEMKGKWLGGRKKGCLKGRPWGNGTIGGCENDLLLAAAVDDAATAAAAGTVELQAAGDIAAKLLVQAPGYVRYSELVDPGAAFADYDVWPATTAIRLSKGITATLEGVVLGADGFPVANAAVRWRPASPTGGVGIPGRSVLEGASLLLPGVATTDSSGAFVIETNQFGGGSVSLQKNPSQAVMTTAVAGQTKNGLELRQ